MKDPQSPGLGKGESDALARGVEPLPPPIVSLNRILAPVDFSIASGNGLRLASAVAREFGAQLDLLYVVESPPYPDWGYAHVVIREENLRRSAEEKLPRFRVDCGVEERQVRSTVTATGRPDVAIVNIARQNETDLIVMASHGMGTIMHALLGSTAERVVRHAECPVLVMRQAAFGDNALAEGTLSIKRILVATDFSELSRRALPYATAFARRFNTPIVLVHVVPSTLPAELSHLGLVIEQNRLIEGAKDLLPLFRDAHLDRGLAVETHVLSGSPSYEICKAAKEHHCDLIVIATRGNTGLKHFWLGSVVEKVVRHAMCAVLVVREREHEFLH